MQDASGLSCYEQGLKEGWSWSQTIYMLLGFHTPSWRYLSLKEKMGDFILKKHFYYKTHLLSKGKIDFNIISKHFMTRSILLYGHYHINLVQSILHVFYWFVAITIRQKIHVLFSFLYLLSFDSLHTFMGSSGT